MPAFYLYMLINGEKIAAENMGEKSLLKSTGFIPVLIKENYFQQNSIKSGINIYSGFIPSK